MADITKPARRRAKNATDQAGEAGRRFEDEAANGAGASNGGGGDEGESGGSSAGETGTITAELKATVREAAIEVLKPVMRNATKSAAKYAVTRGPGLVKDKVAPKIQEAGGAGTIVKGVASKGGGLAETVGGVASGLGGKLGGAKKEGKSPSGTGRGRRLPVQEFVDVGVDLQTAYDQFTQFEDWPQFMHRVERIEQRDDSTLMWHENIWGVRRSWEAEITEQSPCERIAWRSKSGPQTIGVVTFHRLSDRLTRIFITMDFQPKGLFEKTASGTRISRRALKSDLMRFKAFVELRDEPTGGWGGRIEDGEVVDEQDQERDGDGASNGEARDEEPRGSEEGDEDEDDAEPRGSEDDEEPRASEDDEDEDEDDAEPRASEDDEDDEEPRATEHDEDEDEEPRASEDDEDEDEDDVEPRASEDDEDEDEDDVEPRASEDDEDDEEPRASEDDEDEDEEEDDEEPRASKDEEDYEDVDDEEQPAASEDRSEEDDEDEEEQEVAPQPRRRRAPATSGRRKASATSGRDAA